jgi:hypothetical protein
MGAIAHPSMGAKVPFGPPHIRSLKVPKNYATLQILVKTDRIFFPSYLLKLDLPKSAGFFFSGVF